MSEKKDTEERGDIPRNGGAYSGRMRGLKRRALTMYFKFYKAAH
jgi:hypothetical protein